METFSQDIKSVYSGTSQTDNWSAEIQQPERQTREARDRQW